MSEKNVQVSILSLAFNHGKYIRQTLDGFVSQKTDFAFEVIVHDDASTDDTADIIREYAEKYPDIIRPVYQTVNQYSQKKSILKEFVSPLVRGKYIALCEGDDYWTDPDKLQKQFDTLEAHPECTLCVHKIRHIQEDGTLLDTYRPRIDLKEGALDAQGFLDIQKYYPFHTGSYFARAEAWLDYIQNPPTFRKAAAVGDEPLLLYMAAHGNIYYLAECMSVYRVMSIGSWSWKNSQDKNRKVVIARKAYEMMRLYDEYTNHQFDCHLWLYRGRMLLMEKNFRELLKEENRPYVRQLDWKKRIFVYLCAYVPFLGKFMDKLI